MAREETDHLADQWRSQQLEQHLALIRLQVEKAVLLSEITQLEDCAGYLKLATGRTGWRSASKPIALPARVDAAVPIALPLRDAADWGAGQAGLDFLRATSSRGRRMSYANPHYDPDWTRQRGATLGNASVHRRS